MSKPLTGDRELVKAAVEAGCKENADGIAWIRKHHGRTLSSQVYGRQRANLESAGELNGAPTGPTPTLTPAMVGLVPATNAPTLLSHILGNTKPGLLQTLTILKELRDAAGAEQLRLAMDVLATVEGKPLV